MEEFAPEAVLALLNHLLPGFLAAWIFHGLTPHPRKGPFERIVHALVLTAVVQVLVALIRAFLFAIGRHWSIGRWTNDVALAWSLIIAVGLGVAMSYTANTDVIHAKLRKRGITKRTSFPSQWFRVLNNRPEWVVLHLKDGRRALGYPEEWPDQPDEGHFVLVKAAWVTDSGYQELSDGSALVIAAIDVGMMEFIPLREDAGVVPKETHGQEEGERDSATAESANDGRRLLAAPDRRESAATAATNPAGTATTSPTTEKDVVR